MTKNQIWCTMFLVFALITMSIGGCWHVESQRIGLQFSQQLDNSADEASRLVSNLKEVLFLQKKIYESNTDNKDKTGNTSNP